MTNPKPMKATPRERELVAALKKYGKHDMACGVWSIGIRRCTCGLAAAIRGGGR